LFIKLFRKPHSNNAYKSTAPLVKIDISIKGGAFHMPDQKLTIVPVTFHSNTENILTTKPTDDFLHCYTQSSK